MAPTKTDAILDACQEIAQNTLVEGATVDISDAYLAELAIQLALTTETAHTGTKVIVQVSTETSGDEDWVDWAQFVALVGTANSEVITNNPAAVATTALTVASTTGYVTTGWRFLEDVSTFANSEWLFQKTYVTNTSVTVVDGTTREHAQNSILYNVAEARVIRLPEGCVRARILYDNTYDADGSTIAVRSRSVEVTGV